MLGGHVKMKQPGNKKWQRKTQTLIAQVMRCLAHGPVNAEAITSKLQQIFNDRISNISINSNRPHDFKAPIQLGKLPKTKRLRRKYTNYIELLKLNEMGRKQTSDSPSLTIGAIVDSWAGLTGQDKTEFESKVRPKIARLLIVQYVHTKQLGFTDAQAYEKPESAFNFMADLYNILIEETPAEQMAALTQQIQASLIAIGTQPVEVNDELLHDASALVTKELVLRLFPVISHDTAIKDRLLQPVFGALVEMETKKYGWESGVLEDNVTKLQSELKGKGISTSTRTLTHALKKLNRKNISQNIQNVLAGKLNQDLEKEVNEQEVKENQTQSQWVCEPVSPGDQRETEKRILELLFKRRSTND
jgi:hypothetical protein